MASFPCLRRHGDWSEHDQQSLFQNKKAQSIPYKVTMAPLLSHVIPTSGIVSDTVSIYLD